MKKELKSADEILTNVAKLLIKKRIKFTINSIFEIKIHEEGLDKETLKEILELGISEIKPGKKKSMILEIEHEHLPF